MLFTQALGKTYGLKDGSVKPPELYLGASISKYQLPNGKDVWSISSNQYVTASIRTVNDLLKEDGRELQTGKRHGQTPLPTGYQPETDVSSELDDEQASRYLQLIGILRWVIELGQIDIYYEVAMMSQYSATPRTGRIEAVYHIFLYLTKHDKSRIVFDASPPNLNLTNQQVDADWRSFYGDLKEEDPKHMPEPFGRSVNISCFTDANHAMESSTFGIKLRNSKVSMFSKCLVAYMAITHMQTMSSSFQQICQCQNNTTCLVTFA
jgi:hypothetical protein